MSWLDRCLDAEEQLESSRERIEQLEDILDKLLDTDPESSMRASAWISRANRAEELLQELAHYLDDNDSVRDLLPTGFADRVKAQLHTLTILYRDQKTLGETPPPKTMFEQGPSQIEDLVAVVVGQRYDEGGEANLPRRGELPKGENKGNTVIRQHP